VGSAAEWASPTLFFGGPEGRVLGESGAIETVREIAERVTRERGCAVDHVELKAGRGGCLVRIYVDREGGVGLDDLQEVSVEVSAILDATDPIDSPYTLEVSSPGLDRPLRGEVDFRRFVGRLARLSSHVPVDGHRHWIGRLTSVDDGVVTVRLEKEGGKLARIPIDKLSHGRLEVEFPK